MDLTTAVATALDTTADNGSGAEVEMDLGLVVETTYSEHYLDGCWLEVAVTDPTATSPEGVTIAAVQLDLQGRHELEALDADLVTGQLLTAALA